MAPTAVAGGVLMGVAYTRGVPFAAARAVEWIVEHQHELRTLWSTYGVGAVVLDGDLVLAGLGGARLRVAPPLAVAVVEAAATAVATADAALAAALARAVGLVA